MVKRISLKNFKCFENISLDFKELNLFTGMNGMGKSTLIQALLLLRQTYEKNPFFKGQGVLLNGHYVSLGTIKDILYWYRKDDDVQILVEEEKKLWKSSLNEQENMLQMDSEIDDAADCALTGNGFEYISAERLGPRRYYDNLEGELYRKNQIGVKGENALSCLYHIGSDMRVYPNLCHPSEKSERLDLQVNAWMSEISPKIKINAIPYLDVNLMGLRYSAGSRMGEESASAVNMGFGVSYVLPIVVSLLKAKEGDLVIMENPEAHLHPRGQRKIGELIALAAVNRVQIIVETHSDHVLNGIRLAVKNRIMKTNQVGLNYFYEFLDREGMPKHEKTSPEILQDGSLSDWPEGFFDEWDKAVDELFLGESYV